MKSKTGVKKRRDYGMHLQTLIDGGAYGVSQHVLAGR